MKSVPLGLLCTPPPGLGWSPHLQPIELHNDDFPEVLQLVTEGHVEKQDVGSCKPAPCMSGALLLALERVRQEAAAESIKEQACDGHQLGKVESGDQPPLPTPVCPTPATKKKKENLHEDRLSMEDTAGRKSSKEAPMATITFPVPIPLEGVKSRKKVILKMEDVNFCHAGTDKPTLKDVSFAVSQASRMLVVGATSAGKTTLAKIFCGEVTPTHGAVMRAAGLHIVCLAEHTIRRLEEHAQKTPEQYLMWRYSSGVDQETSNSQKFKDGHQKLASPRQLVSQCISQIFLEFSVDRESATQKKICQLTDAVKARVYLAASMWTNPHVLLLDEPLKFFSSQDLQAVLLSLDDYKGGVIINSHTKDANNFEGAGLEKWTLRGGQLRMQGEAPLVKPQISAVTQSIEAKTNRDRPSVQGSSAKVANQPSAPGANAKAAKTAIKELEKQLRDGIKDQSLSNEEMNEMVNKVKAMLMT
jgi:ABC-type molybdenum transport system ATPase subunit/photorepair protein PhrA